MNKLILLNELESTIPIIDYYTKKEIDKLVFGNNAPVFNNYETTCIQVTNNPNILRQVKNLYNFGIGCSVIDGTEPWFVDDFLTGRASLFVLNKADVDYVEKNIYG